MNYGRLATGIVFLALFLGFELHIGALEKLIPGTYAGLTSGNYLGFAFLLGALGALGSAFSSAPAYPGPPGAGTAQADPYAVAAAMMAMQQRTGGPTAPAGAPSPAPPSQPPMVACPACGAPNLPGAKFCQACGQSIPAAPST